MKKRIPLFLSFLLTVITLSAQKPQCCLNGGEEAKLAAKMAAAKAAAQDGDIIGREDQETGEIAYFRKDFRSKTGEATLCPVEYCTKSGRFVNLSPGTGASCSKNGAGCSKASAGPASAQAPAGNQEADSNGGNSVAQRAACSSAISKSKNNNNTRKPSIPVKLVSNWQ